MKVSELKEELNKFDPDLDVLCYTEDARFVTANTGFTLLDIEKVTVMHGERKRLGDGTPTLKLGKGPNSVKLAALEVTVDF
jgi:hypothetical protein